MRRALGRDEEQAGSTQLLLLHEQRTRCGCWGGLGDLLVGMQEGKASAAVISLHLQNIMKTVTLLGLFPGFLQSLAGTGTLLQRFAGEPQITHTLHPCWESQIHHPAWGCSPKPQILAWTPLLGLPPLPLPTSHTFLGCTKVE